jgi:nucleotide-binding universal stress UspA family protein
MSVILAVVTQSPYRDAILRFANEFSGLLGADLWLLRPSSRPPADEFEAVVEAEGLADLAEEEVEERAEDGVATSDMALPPAAREIPVPERTIIESTVRELAQCDIGVVGKGLHGEPTGGRGIGPGIDRLKKLTTKPLVIVPTAVEPIRRALFVYTQHPEAGHALSLAKPLSEKGVAISLVTVISPLGRTELVGAGEGYLRAHDVPFKALRADCESCEPAGGPVSEILQLVRQESIDLVVMGGTRRGPMGGLLWPEMAREVVWNAHVPVLIWY